MRNFSPPLLMFRKIFGSIWIQKSEFEICETKEAAWTKYASASHEIQCLARLKNIYTGQTLSAVHNTAPVDLYLALFSRLCVPHSYMGVSSERGWALYIQWSGYQAL